MLAERHKYNGTPTLVLNELQQATKLQVDGKVNSKQYNFETVVCLICEGEGFEKISEKDRYGLYYPVVICRDCGLVQTNPRMNQAAYNEFYNTEYRKLYVGTECPGSNFFKLQFQKGKLIFDFLQENGAFTKPLEEMFVFEVGCGAGGILHYFREKGCEVKGIDLGEEYVEYGKNTHQLDLETGFLKDIQLTKKPDLVIYSHVVEHILEPDKEFVELKNKIKDSTIIYIEVPGIKHLSNYKMNLLRYLQNAHTYHFSLKTLENLMSKSGFELLKGNSYIKSIFKINKKNMPKKMENDYSEVMVYLRNMERKRKLYPFTIMALKQATKSILIKTLDTIGIKNIIKQLIVKKK